MKNTITRWAALGAATVVATAVLAPLGAPAQAAGDGSIYYYVASKSGAPAALYNRGTGARLSPAGAEVKDVRASRDGSRLVDLEVAKDSAGNLVYSVRVYDVSGHVLNTVASVPSYVGEIRSPNISPDGSVVVWTRHDNNAAAFLYRKTLATGVTAALGTDLYDAVFASASSLIVRKLDGTGHWMPLSGGTPAAIANFPWQAVGVTVSPNGSKIAWEHELGTSPATANIGVAGLHVASNGAVTIDAPGTWKFPATGPDPNTRNDNYAPAFTRDGTRVFFISADNETIGYGQVMSAPVDDSANPVVVDGTDLVKVVTQAIGALPPASSLVQPAPQPALLAGTSATVKWLKPSDPDVSQVLVRRFYGSTLQKYKFVPLPTTSWTDTGLVVGRVYKYEFISVDRGGRRSTATIPTRSLIATTALPSASDPTSNATTKAPFMVRFGSAPTTARWTVDYRVNSGSTWTRWLTNATGSSTRTFTAGLVGRTYQFSAKASYPNGDATKVVYSARTVVPYNQTSASLSGGTTVSNTNAWLGSLRKMTRTSNYAKFTVTGNRLQIIAWRCSGCGSFALYENGVRIATVSTYSSSTRARSVVYTRFYSSNVTRSFAIKPLGTAGHPAILLDGFAMRR
jgi:hypothetical protein